MPLATAVTPPARPATPPMAATPPVPSPPVPSPPVAATLAAEPEAIDVFCRGQLTPPRRPSPLGPHRRLSSSGESALASPSSPAESSPGAVPVRPWGVFGARPARRASNAQRRASAESLQEEALCSVLRQMFLSGRETRKPLATPAIEHVRTLASLEVAFDEDTQERWHAVRFGEAFYLAVIRPEAEPSKVWYYVGDWPHRAQDTAQER